MVEDSLLKMPVGLCIIKCGGGIDCYQCNYVQKALFKGQAFYYLLCIIKKNSYARDFNVKCCFYIFSCRLITKSTEDQKGQMQNQK